MKSPPLIATKLYIPRLRPGLVSRPQLLVQLDTGLQDAQGRFLRKLTLISAPAGFGKTTLLSEWTAACPAAVAWVSLDERDNDPARFWSYAIAALNHLHPVIGASALAALSSSQSPQIDLLLTGLINDLSTYQADGTHLPIVLILDDFHTLTSPEVHEGIIFLVDNSPPNLHMVISSRADPPWPLARLRVRRELNELRVKDLRFSPEEVAAFLNEVMQLELSAEDLATLDTRTEGWAAGLQMAALAIKGSVFTAATGTVAVSKRRTVSAFIRLFSGSHRFVLDYLVEEVLEQQPAPVQQFLLHTSILERLSAPLCDRVLERDDSQTVLDHLHKANLFLVQLDDERHWARYHHLFADLLRQRLEQIEPQLVAQLHRRASQWFEDQGQIADAVTHALAADDLTQVTHLAEENVLALMERGELNVLAGWLKALPDEVIHSWPWLCTACAWALVHAGQFAEAQICLETLVEIIENNGRIPSADILWGHINAIYLYIVAMTFTDWEQASTYAETALALLPQNDRRTRGLVAVLRGYVQRTNHDYAAARASLSEALVASKIAGEPYAVVDLLCQLARVEAQQGKLRQAAAICEEAIQQAQTGWPVLPIVSYAHTSLAAILLEWDQLESALHHVHTAARLSQQWGHFDSWIESQQLLAQITHACGRSAEALDTLQQAAQQFANAPAYVANHELLIRLETGDLTFAEERAEIEKMVFQNACFGPYLTRNLLLARIRIAQYRHSSRASLDDVLQHLVNMQAQLQPRGATRNCIQILVLQAMAMQAEDREDSAVDALETALSLAEPEGYVWTFIREGEPMARLLRRAAARGITVSYAAALLSAMEKRIETGLKREEKGAADLVESLSDREMQVLRLLLTSLNSTEIAGELVIAPSTVRSHIKSIYAKLGVHNRMESITRARELGLV